MKKEYKAPELEVIKLYEEILTEEAESIIEDDPLEGDKGDM